MSETTTYTDHTVAVYATHDLAEASVRSLSGAGFDMKKLSIIGQDYHTEERPIGFFWGLLFGSAFMFLPGIGHVMFAGYIIGALQGAFLGGSFGVIGGALSSFGVPDNSVVEYESELKAGSFLLIAHGDEAETKRAKDLLSSTPTTRLDSYSNAKVHGGHH